MNRDRLFLIGTSLLFLLFVLLPNLVQLHYGCFPAYDLGIMSEAILAGWRQQWDPFLNVRESYLSQDHWDPITLLIGYVTTPLSAFVAAPVFLIFLEPLIILASALYFRGALLKRRFSNERAWLGFLMILFSRVTWNALQFPVHPSTWALLPCLGLAVWWFDFFNESRDQKMLSLVGRYLGWGLLLWLCGEQFSLVLLMSSLALAFAARSKKERTLFFGVFALIGLMAWWAFSGRSFLRGSIYGHAGRLSFDLNKMFAFYLLDFSFVRGFFEGTLGFLFPLILFFTWATNCLRNKTAREWIFNLKRDDLMVFILVFIFSPLIAGRFLALSWSVHYGIVWVPILAPLLLIQKEWAISVRRYPWCLALLLASSISSWSQIFHFAKTPAPGCSALTAAATPEDFTQRREDIARVVSLLPEGARVMVGQHLVPVLQSHRADLEIHSLGPFVQVEQSMDFDYLWIPSGSFGNQWPLSQEHINQLIESLSPTESLKMQTSILFKGPFQARSFSPFETEPPMKRFR